jgi:hypothetical protein
MKSTKAAASAIVVVSALALAACGSSGSGGSSSGSSKPILIGEAAGTTGAYGTTGQAMVNGRAGPC